MLKPLSGMLLLLLVPVAQAKSRPQEKIFSPGSEILSAGDMTKIPDILPTMYYTPSEEKVNCAGGYGRARYRGTERTKLLDPNGNTIATVCTRFAKTLLMEGAGILRDRGQGEKIVNYGGSVRKVPRYFFLDRCKFGEGVTRDLCLLPYHTIAADNTHHKVDEIIFVPEAEGVALPDGTVHDGLFIVRDTGGAFNGIGSQRVDLFTGTDPDFDNAFQKAGFHHKRPMDAFKVTGESAERVKEKFRAQFGDLY